MCRSEGVRIRHFLKKQAKVGIGVLLIVFIFLGHPALAQQLDAWHLLPKPEPFTEFYFTRPNAPLTSEPHTLGLTIRNNQQQMTEYHYTITAGSARSEPQVLKTGTCVVKQSETCDINEPLELPPAANLLRATINYQGRTTASSPLEPLSQSLYFRLRPTIEKEGA